MQESAIDLDGHRGLLVRPRGAEALYVFAHGAGAGMRHSFMAEVAEALAKHAIATLRWEFPYMAAGKPRPDSPAVAEAAVRAVWNASKKHARGLPRFAGGKSFGGRMTSNAHASAPLPELRGIAFLGFPLHPPERVVQAAQRRARPVDRAEHLARANGPMLFLQGTRDELADLDKLRPVVTQLGARATLHVVEGADHGFDVLVGSGRTHDEVIDELARTLTVWIEAVLDG